MAPKKDETASFMLRFTQKVFNNESGEPQVQWRGNIRHVQGGDEKRFSSFDEAVAFIQSKLADLTFQAMEDKPIEEQKGILSKSFDLWKKMAFDAPRMMVETIKDPKKQVAQLQDQIQDQIEQVKGGLAEKLEINSWLAASKDDYQQIMQMLGKLSNDISALNEKVDRLSKNSEE
ncbi:MAG: hypothetical protein AAFO03_16550 [Bacteroidota bacterium]